MPTAKRLAGQKQAVIGLDLGGTKLASALFDVEGEPLVKRSLPLERRARGTRLANWSSARFGGCCKLQRKGI